MQIFTKNWGKFNSVPNYPLGFGQNSMFSNNSAEVVELGDPVLLEYNVFNSQITIYLEVVGKKCFSIFWVGQMGCGGGVEAAQYPLYIEVINS